MSDYEPLSRECELLECTERFAPKRSDQRYCSGRHASKGWRRARGVAAEEPQTCAREGCEQTFIAYRRVQQFCSKTCRDEHNRADLDWMARNRQRVRARYWADPQVKRRTRLGRYGLTEEQYDAMFSGQGNGCAICHSPDPRGSHWHIDHDHTTGRVRGILCSFCNPAIGYMADDPDRLIAAAEYLRRHRAGS